jgi:hypothetical protein
MSAVTPNRELLDDERVPRVTLAGQQWPIPKMAPRQNEIIVPLILDHEEAVFAAAAQDEGGKVTFRPTTEMIHRMNTIVFHALQRGHRELTREEFDDMPIGLVEALDSIRTISRQTGSFRERVATDPPLANGGTTSAAVASPTGLQ